MGRSTPALNVSTPTITWVEEARVHDGDGGSATVRVGDQVDLLDPENKFMLEYLGGPGPHTIRQIGQWRCGRKQLYLEPKGGAHASQFKIHR